MVNWVITLENLNQCSELQDLVESSGATHRRMTPLFRVGRASNASDHYLTPQELERLVSFVAQARSSMNIDFGESHTILGRMSGYTPGKPFFCGAGLTRCAVMPVGEVLGCQQVYCNDYSESNIREIPFSSIWKNGFQQFRSTVQDPQCLSCFHLKACQGGCWAQRVLEGTCLKDLLKE